MTETRNPNLRDGCEWADHEDCIIGDEAGLQALRRACGVALEDGEYYGSDLGEYVGVKKLDSQWFKAPADSPGSRFGNAILAVVLLGLLALVVIGGVTVLSWLIRAAA